MRSQSPVRRSSAFTALAEPIENVSPWNIVRFRPKDKEDPSRPRSGGFMPGIVLGVTAEDAQQPSLIVMPILFLPEYEEPDPTTEQVVKDKQQLHQMGLIREDPRLIRAQVRMRITNGDGFLSSSSFPDGKNLRSVPPHLAKVLTRKFANAMDLKAACKARFCTPVYDWGGSSPEDNL